MQGSYNAQKRKTVPIAHHEHKPGTSSGTSDSPQWSWADVYSWSCSTRQLNPSPHPTQDHCKPQLSRQVRLTSPAPSLILINLQPHPTISTMDKIASGLYKIVLQDGRPFEQVLTVAASPPGEASPVGVAPWNGAPTQKVGFLCPEQRDMLR
jgi:hypothetical protein